MTSIPDTSTGGLARPAMVKPAQSVAGWLMPLFFCVVLMPMAFNIADLRLTPLRIVLLVLFVPFLIRIFAGKAGRVTVVDVLMLLHAFWIVLALMVVHGVAKLPFAGITMVELVGGYILGRVLVQNAEDYRRMIRFLLYAMIFLAPFAIIELLTARMIIPELVGTVFETNQRHESAYGRIGLERVYSVFEHPILYGMFCSLAIANLFYMARGTSLLRYGAAVFATFMTFMALSSAPLLAIGVQVLMAIWDRVTKGAWTTSLIIFVVCYVTIDLLSNRTPITILIETLTFNPLSGWTRILIFEHGIQNVLASPWFGIGFNDWTRPPWLTSSVDNFWLLTAMRYGFVGAGLIILAFVSHFFLLTRAKVTDPDLKRLRTGYAIALGTACFCLVTVHVWGAVSVFMMFYVGAGAFFYTHPESVSGLRDEEPDPKATRREALRYTRFPSNAERARTGQTARVSIR